MNTIKNILAKYNGKTDRLDIELLIADAIGKPREFVLAHPGYKLTQSQIANLKSRLLRRSRHEPLAYILGHKEFYGLDFKVDKHTLIPRPETELLVEKAIKKIQNSIPSTRDKIQNSVIDVGTGSGNIIIAVAHSAPRATNGKLTYFGIDLSEKALRVARQNAKAHRLDKKIKFLKGNLLNPILKSKNHKLEAINYTILANLPYLSQEIYAATAPNVKKYEPKSALYSATEGLAHYEKLLRQIKKLRLDGGLPHITCLFEFSPEQKNKISKLIKSCFPKVTIEFHKDLAGKWRMVEFEV